MSDVEEEGEDVEIVEVEEEEEGEEVEVVEVVEEEGESEEDEEEDEEEEVEVEEASDKEESGESEESEEEAPKKKERKRKKVVDDDGAEDRSFYVSPPIPLIPKKRKRKGGELSEEQKKEITEEAREMRKVYKKYYTIDGGLTEIELMNLLKKNKITPLMTLPKAPNDSYAQTAFIYACMKGYRKAAMYLYDKRVKDSDPNAAEAKALRWMCGMKDPDLKLITKMIKDKDRCEIHNRSNMAIINACKGGHLKIVKLLLTAKTSKFRKVGVSCGEKDGQALIYAVVSGNPGIVKLLLERKDVDPTCQQFTPVKQAAKSLEGAQKGLKKAKNEDKKKVKKQQVKNFSVILKLLLLDPRMEEHLPKLIVQ